MIELHAETVAAQILTDHVVVKVRAGRWRRRKVCSLCQRPVPCPAVQHAGDLRAGRVDVSGRPLAAVPRATTWWSF